MATDRRDKLQRATKIKLLDGVSRYKINIPRQRTYLFWGLYIFFSVTTYTIQFSRLFLAHLFHDPCQDDKNPYLVTGPRGTIFVFKCLAEQNLVTML